MQDGVEFLTRYLNTFIRYHDCKMVLHEDTNVTHSFLTGATLIIAGYYLNLENYLETTTLAQT